MKPTSFLFSIAALCTIAPAQAAGTRELQAEYEQVRKIAMKDPGVRAAFAKANQKLNARILEIDPALRPIVEGQPAGQANPAPQPAKRGAPAKPMASYIVAKGDTLTSIAALYKVSVADLKSANGIADERKLQAGQKLRIPAQ
jgi:nucleoid-associated protein YgaU